MLGQERRSSFGRHGVRNTFSLSPTLLCAGGSLALFLVLGGGPIEANIASLVMLSGGACCLIMTGSRGGLHALRQLPLAELLCVITIVAIPVIQLIPFPPLVWKALPGRDMENSLLELAGLSSNWLPISLDRAGTLATLTFGMAFGGLFLGGLSLPESDIKRLLVLLVTCAVLSFAIGAIQLSTSGQLTLYPSSHRGSLLGFFANRNHQGLFLAISILTVSWLIGSSAMTPQRRPFVFGFYALIALAAAFGTASRTGLALCLLAMVAGPFMFLGVEVKRKTTVLVGAIAATALISLISISQVASGTLTRYGDITADGRWKIWERSTVLLRDYFPIGTGLGAYPDVYKKYEAVEWILPQYVNAAHNDYMQLIIESGILGLALLLLVGAVIFRSVRLNFGNVTHEPIPGAHLARLGISILALVLVHSLVDYPLRRPAIGAIFALSLALVLRQRIAWPVRRREAVPLPVVGQVDS